MPNDLIETSRDDLIEARNHLATTEAQLEAVRAGLDTLFHSIELEHGNGDEEALDGVIDADLDPSRPQRHPCPHQHPQGAGGETVRRVRPVLRVLLRLLPVLEARSGGGG